MELRRSRRLQGLLPELELDNEWKACFVCFGSAQPWNKNVILLECCGNVIHRHCQNKWKSNNHRCGMCKKAFQPAWPLENEDHDTMAEFLDVLLQSNMERMVVVTFVNTVLCSDHFENRLCEVSTLS